MMTALRQHNGQVLYSCSFVPPEWIAAHGLLPVRFPCDTPVGRPGAAPEGFCPYARAFQQHVSESRAAAAAVFTTACDQMRRAAEIATDGGGSPVFLLNVPSACGRDALREYYRGELVRLGRFLTQCGGSAPSAAALAAAMRRFDAARAHRRSVAAAAAQATVAGCGDTVRIGLLGAPLVGGTRDIPGILAKAGGRIVLDGTGGGERTLPRPFRPEGLETDPLSELAAAYFDSIPDAFRRPDSLLHEWLDRSLAERDARGLILLCYAWCDLWHALGGRLRDRLRIPVLSVTLDAEDRLPAHIRTRLEAFVEVLRD